MAAAFGRALDVLSCSHGCVEDLEEGPCVLVEEVGEDSKCGGPCRKGKEVHVPRALYV